MSHFKRTHCCTDEFLFSIFFFVVHILVRRAIRRGWFTMFSYFRNGSTRKMLHRLLPIRRMCCCDFRLLPALITAKSHVQTNAYAVGAPTVCQSESIAQKETCTKDDNLPFPSDRIQQPNLNRLFIRIYYFHSAICVSHHFHRHHMSERSTSNSAE